MCIRDSCIDYILENAPEEMKFFNTMIDKSCIERITKVRNSDFKRMTYTEAIDLLLQADVKFDNKVEWGMDLNSEHERYICEKIVDGPVFLTDYPKEIKAFYMRVNDDGKTVAACDLLVPGVGELVGGSQREERYDVLEARMKDMGMTTDSLQWYMDLRRYGGCKHAGFGLGFDRLLMYLTGMQNIRDVEPFPRTPKNLLFMIPVISSRCLYIVGTSCPSSSSLSMVSCRYLNSKCVVIMPFSLSSAGCWMGQKSNTS